MPSEAQTRWARSLEGRRVGVALSSGFFGFYAHAGFLKAIDELGIRPSALSGTSAGALVAGLRAAGLNPKELEALFRSLTREDFWERRRWLALLGAAARGFSGYRGYLSGTRFRELLERSLPVRTFEECTVPLYVASSNITEGRRHLFSSGSLVDALHASCAYPFLFATAVIGGSHHMDGGLVDKLPVEELVAAEKVDVLLVNYLTSDAGSGNAWLARPLSMLRALRRGLDVVRNSHARWKLRWAESLGCRTYVFCPTLPRVGPRRMGEGGRAIEAGYRETLRIIEDDAFLTT